MRSRGTSAGSQGATTQVHQQKLNNARSRRKFNQILSTELVTREQVEEMEKIPLLSPLSENRPIQGCLSTDVNGGQVTREFVSSLKHKELNQKTYTGDSDSSCDDE